MQERNSADVLAPSGCGPCRPGRWWRRCCSAPTRPGCRRRRWSSCAAGSASAGGTTRVALSRMVAAGELAAEDGHYRLVGEGLLSRQRTQDDALDPPAAPLGRGWRMAVVVSAGRAAAERVELRRAFADARFAEWREGVWLRPDNLGPPAPDRRCRRRRSRGRRSRSTEAPVRWLTVEPDDDPAALAARAVGPAGWAARGEALLGGGPRGARRSRRRAAGVGRGRLRRRGGHAAPSPHRPAAARGAAPAGLAGRPAPGPVRPLPHGHPAPGPPPVGGLTGPAVAPSVLAAGRTEAAVPIRRRRTARRGRSG